MLTSYGVKAKGYKSNAADLKQAEQFIADVVAEGDSVVFRGNRVKE